MPKSKLIETAAQLVYRQGWNGTGINQILGDAQVPKGSFYYYFHSKEELGVAIVKFHGQNFRKRYERTFLNAQLRGSEAIEAYLDETTARYRESGWSGGCPVGTFSNEVADSVQRLAEACREVLTDFMAALAVAIERGQRDGTIMDGEPAAKLATQFLSLWQGMLLQMKLMKSEEPLSVGREFVRRAFYKSC